MGNKDRRFPVQGGPTVPWEMVAIHERQMKKNHGQTMEQLSRRGGLSCLELLLVLEDRELREIYRIPKGDFDRRSREAHDEIEQKMADFEHDMMRVKLEKAKEELMREVARNEEISQELRRSRQLEIDGEAAWRWEGDGEDHLESMGNDMAVLIRAGDLRGLIADVSKKVR